MDRTGILAVVLPVLTAAPGRHERGHTHAKLAEPGYL